MKVSAILKGLLDSNGQQPIQIRVNQGTKRTFFPTKIKVSPDQFKNGKVSGHPKAKELNDRLKTLIIQYQAKALEPLEKKIPRTDFYSFVKAIYPTLGKSKGTEDFYRYQLAKLEKFSPSLYAHDINEEWLDRYKAWMVKRGDEQSTMWNAFKFLRKFVKLAKKKHLIAKNPFEDYESAPQYLAPDVNYLSKDEVQKMDEYLRTEGCPRMIKQVGTWFLIGCYVGLRISDIMVFNPKKHLFGDRLVMRAAKTNELFGVPINSRVREYMERVEYQPPTVKVNQYNNLLKVLAGALDLDKRLSSHIARHTCAMLLSDAGVSREVIGKILGHKSYKSTEIYAKISTARSDNDYKQAMGD